MEVNLQRCEVCKKVNTEEAKDWVRINGASNSPTDRRIFPLDFCADCAGKTTVAQAVKFQPPVPQVQGPRLRPQAGTIPVVTGTIPPPPTS